MGLRTEPLVLQIAASFRHRRQLPRAVVCKEQLESEEAAATEMEGSAAAVWGEGGRRGFSTILLYPFPSLPPPLCSVVAEDDQALSFPKQQHLASLVLRSLDRALAEAPLCDISLVPPHTLIYLECLLFPFHWLTRCEIPSEIPSHIRVFSPRMIQAQ